MRKRVRGEREQNAKEETLNGSGSLDLWAFTRLFWGKIEHGNLCTFTH